jgi:choline dehydrogenase-like flavoprotein
MARQIYDVIVIGTGAGGGMAIKTLCEAGLKVCALNAGRRLDPEKDFRYHRMPWDMKFRGLDDPKRRAESYGYMDNEYTKQAWEHEIPFTTAPGTKWMWPRCFAVGGKTNFWGRSSARFSEIDFRAASLDGYDVDWPVTYDEMAGYYTRVEKMIGVASSIQNRPSNPDGAYLPAMNFRCVDRILEAGAKKIGVPYLPDRIAQLTQKHEGHPACHFCGECTTGCDVGAFFSTPYFLLPKAEATKNLEMRTNALAKNILVDENGRASGVAYIDRTTKQEVEVLGHAVVVAASCVESSRIMLNSKSRQWPNGIANSSGQLGRNLCDHLYGESAPGIFAAASRTTQLPRSRFRQHHRVDAALAESEGPTRREVHPRIFGLPRWRLLRLPLVCQRPRRFWFVVQARDQAPLSHSSQLHGAGAIAALGHELYGPRP